MVDIIFFVFKNSYVCLFLCKFIFIYKYVLIRIVKNNFFINNESTLQQILNF